jgi:hypothetical protein
VVGHQCFSEGRASCGGMAMTLFIVGQSIRTLHSSIVKFCGAVQGWLNRRIGTSCSDPQRSVATLRIFCSAPKTAPIRDPPHLWCRPNSAVIYFASSHIYCCTLITVLSHFYKAKLNSLTRWSRWLPATCRYEQQSKPFFISFKQI